MLFFVIFGHDSIEVMDTAVDTIADHIQPDRAIEVPSMSLKIQNNGKQYYMTSPNIKIQFSKKVEILRKIVEANKGEGLDDILGLFNFFNIDKITSTITGLSNNISSLILEAGSSLLGQIVDKAAEPYMDGIYKLKIANLINIEDVTSNVLNELEDCINNDGLASEDRNKCQQCKNDVNNLITIVNEDINNSLIHTKDELLQNTIYKYNTTGMPLLFNRLIMPTLNYNLNFISNKANKLIDSVFSILFKDIHISTITGPLSLAYNVGLYDIGKLFAYTSLIFHLELIGFLFIGFALKLRAKHLLKPKRKSKHSDDSDDELDNLDEDDQISRRKKEKASKLTSHNSHKKKLNKRRKSDDDYSEEIEEEKAKSKTKKIKEKSEDSDSSNEIEDAKPNNNLGNRKSSRISNPSTPNNGSQFWLDFE